MISFSQDGTVEGNITLQGTARSSQADGTLNFYNLNSDDPVAIINEGLIEAIGTGYVQFNDSFINRGILRTSGTGTIWIGGDVLLDTGTQLLGDGGRYVLSGLVDVGGHTFNLAMGYEVELRGN